MQSAIDSKIGSIRQRFGNSSIAATLLIVAMTIFALASLWTAGTRPGGSANPAAIAVVKYDTRQEQDEMLDRLQTAPYLAEIARMAPVSCDSDCYTVLQQQMVDLAEQVKRGW
jgi:hypothetical protein